MKIYLACPFSSDDPTVRQWRFDSVNVKACELMANGHIVFSPISHSYPIALAGDLPLGWDFWERMDRAFIEWADEVWVLMLDGWNESEGIRVEINIAGELGRPVRYI